jgi:RHS repeat-associated protein
MSLGEIMFFNGVFGKCQLSYFHANGQTLMQRRYQADPNYYDNFFYLHDRLGSTRQVINASASVANSYTYDPWGNAFASETSETISNHYWFANYHWDGTSGLYYLNGRWYDPVILRFTGRDPVKGKYQEPLTLHQYLYCFNNPTNRIDPTGRMSTSELVSVSGIRGWLMKSLTSQIMKNIGAGALTGGLVRGAIGGNQSGDWSWSDAFSEGAKGALYGGIGGGAAGCLASLSASGYIFAAFEESLIAQGLVAGGAAGAAEGIINRESLREIFIRATVGGIGGIFGGVLGEVAPPFGGIPGGIAGGELTTFFYEFFFSWYGGWPSLNE